jgi:phage FluMu protein Com
MSDNIKYIWRCAKCTNHFANINRMEGLIKQEKKCPKCKSLNILTLTNGEIFIQCKSAGEEMCDYEYDRDKSYFPPL